MIGREGGLGGDGVFDRGQVPRPNSKKKGDAGQ